MEWFLALLAFIFGSFLLLKPYEDPKGKHPTGLTLKERLRRQFLNL